MPRRIRKEKQVQERQTEEVDDTPTKTKEEIKAETDALLDEIDSVLEVNADEFVRGYVQKGGQ